jgi:hypothetical protein
MMSRKIVSQPLTARMNFGSPCTDAHNERFTLTYASLAEIAGRPPGDSDRPKTKP